VGVHGIHTFGTGLGRALSGGRDEDAADFLSDMRAVLLESEMDDGHIGIDWMTPPPRPPPPPQQHQHNPPEPLPSHGARSRSGGGGGGGVLPLPGSRQLIATPPTIGGGGGGGGGHFVDDNLDAGATAGDGQSESLHRHVSMSGGGGRHARSISSGSIPFDVDGLGSYYSVLPDPEP
jgi:hypothetical protein